MQICLFFRVSFMILLVILVVLNAQFLWEKSVNLKLKEVKIMTLNQKKSYHMHETRVMRLIYSHVFKNIRNWHKFEIIIIFWHFYSWMPFYFLFFNNKKIKKHCSTKSSWINQNNAKLCTLPLWILTCS